MGCEPVVTLCAIIKSNQRVRHKLNLAMLSLFANWPIFTMIITLDHDSLGFFRDSWIVQRPRRYLKTQLEPLKTFCSILGTRILESKKTAAPAFSFGARPLNRNLTYGPGPAQYNITGLASKGKDTPPQISLQSRAKPNKIIETPAPGEYHIERSDKYIVSSAPKFTFGVKKYCGITNYETPGMM